MQLSKVNTFQVPVLNEELQTMSSKEIAELTGKQHSHVVRDIRNMLDDLQKDDPEMDYPKEDKDNRGYTSCFHLNKELSITLVAGYNTSMRLAIVRRWQELEAKEKQNVLMLPNFTDPAEAAMAWALQYKEKQIALQQLEVAKPKAEFVDKYVERGSLKILTDVAKELGVSGKTLGKWLREEGWAWKDTTKLRWTQEFIDKGYGETKHFTSPGGFDGSQAYVTAAGDLFIKQNFKQSK